MPFVSLGLGDKGRGMPRGWNVSLALFITSVSGNKSFVSFPIASTSEDHKS